MTKLTRHELEVMDLFWDHGTATIREILDLIPAKRRPAYTTVQTVVNRLEAKGALLRTGKVGNAHTFEPVITRPRTYRRIISDVVKVVGSAQQLVSHLVESGELSLEDLRALEEELSDREAGS